MTGARRACTAVVAVAMSVALTGCGDGVAITAAPPEPTDDQLTQAASTWVNQLGLAQTDVAIWRSRLRRACSEGVWEEATARALAAEFIGQDSAVSMRDPSLGAPTPGEGAQALWLMAIGVCRDAFPADAIERGPPVP